MIPPEYWWVLDYVFVQQGIQQAYRLSHFVFVMFTKYEDESN